MCYANSDVEKMETALSSKLPRGVGRATKYFIASPEEGGGGGIGIWSNKFATYGTDMGSLPS